MEEEVIESANNLEVAEQEETVESTVETETTEEVEEVVEQEDIQTEEPKEEVQEKQSKEENSKYANARRRAEEEAQKKIEQARKEAYEKGLEQGKIQSYIGKQNPYTGQDIKDNYDVQEYLEMFELDSNGKDPISGYRELQKEKARKEAEEKIKAEEKEKQDNWYKDDTKDFVEKYSVEKLQELTKDADFNLFAEGKIGKEKVILAKPQTYMNLSGESVRELISFFKIDLSDVIVIYDDFDLNCGFIRIRENGSAGTHNGMRSIIQEIASSAFPRIRVGFKPEGGTDIPLLNLVLSGISEKDKPIFNKSMAAAANAATEFANGKSLQQIMQKYNGKAE